MEGVAAGERPERPLTQECNDALWTLISRCWDISPAQRPGITQVCTSIQQLEIKGSSGMYFAISIIREVVMNPFLWQQNKPLFPSY